MSKLKVRHTAIDDMEEDKKSKDRKDKDEDGEMIKISPPMINIEGAGLFRLHSINTLQLEFEMQTEPTMKLKYGYSINKGMTPSTFYPVVDVFVWYESVEERDEKFQKIKEALIECGVEIFIV